MLSFSESNYKTNGTRSIISNISQSLDSFFQKCQYQYYNEIFDQDILYIRRQPVYFSCRIACGQFAHIISKMCIRDSCLAVALYMMVSPEQITERMARLEQIAMRLEVKEGKKGCVLSNDSYNSDLASLDIALDFMSRRADDKGKKRTLILSDMLETGQSSKLLYRQVAELVHSRGVEKIIGVGEEIRTAAARFEIEKYFFRTT